VVDLKEKANQESKGEKDKKKSKVKTDWHQLATGN
jgi:hypothetical protein